MAHRNSLLLDAIAEQLLSELFAYARMLEELRGAGWPMPLAAALADQADRVQRCATQLPRLQVALAEFLITRTELARRLVGPGGGRAEALAALHATHLDAVNAAWPKGEGQQP